LDEEMKMNIETGSKLELNELKQILIKNIMRAEELN